MRLRGRRSVLRPTLRVSVGLGWRLRRSWSEWRLNSVRKIGMRGYGLRLAVRGWFVRVSVVTLGALVRLAGLVRSLTMGRLMKPEATNERCAQDCFVLLVARTNGC